MSATLLAPCTTDRLVAQLRADGLHVTAQRPGVVVANNGDRHYRYEQTSAGWRSMDVGGVLTCRCY